MPEHEYEELHLAPWPQFLATLAGGDPSDVVRAVLAIALEGDDLQVIEGVAYSATLSGDPAVRRAGVLALAHSARRVGSTQHQAIDALRARLGNDPTLFGALHDLMDDIATFAVAPAEGRQ